MFQRLQQKWKVNGWRLLLILVTFALGGSLCGYLGRQLLGWLDIGSAIIRIPLYVVLVTLLWPFCIMMISIPTGQFVFFRAYLKKIGARMTGQKPAGHGNTGNAITARPGNTADTIGNRSAGNPVGNDNRTAAAAQQHFTQAKSDTLKQETTQPASQPGQPTRIAVFASGAGSNAQKIIDYFRDSPTIRVALIVCNKPGAGVLNIATKEHIPILLIEKEPFFRGNGYVDELSAAGIDFIVLAGFLWKVPSTLTAAYPNRIVNIHPALLPRYGGKGMYGMYVHEAIIAAGEKESGITIHYVDNVYDNGDIIFQATCSIEPGDTAATLAQKVHQLEHAHYPRIIEEVIGHLQNPR